MSLEVRVDKITSDGVSLEEEVNLSSSDLNTGDIIFSQPIKVEVFAQRNRNEITVKARLVGSTKMRCARCLEYYESKIDKNIIKYYEVSKTKSIDLWQELREDLILDFPMKLLCNVDCKGLCSVCGENLNKSSCLHRK